MEGGGVWTMPLRPSPSKVGEKKQTCERGGWEGGHNRYGCLSETGGLHDRSGIGGEAASREVAALRFWSGKKEKKKTANKKDDGPTARLIAGPFLRMPTKRRTEMGDETTGASRGYVVLILKTPRGGQEGNHLGGKKKNPFGKI